MPPRAAACRVVTWTSDRPRLRPLVDRLFSNEGGTPEGVPPSGVSGTRPQAAGRRAMKVTSSWSSSRAMVRPASVAREAAQQGQRRHRVGAFHPGDLRLCEPGPLGQLGLRESQRLASLVHGLGEGHGQPDLRPLGPHLGRLGVPLRGRLLAGQLPARVVHDAFPSLPRLYVVWAGPCSVRHTIRALTAWRTWPCSCGRVLRKTVSSTILRPGANQ